MSNGNSNLLGNRQGEASGRVLCWRTLNDYDYWMDLA